MEFKKILPHIYHLYMDDCYKLVMTFVRYQEYYEGMEYKGQIFSLIDYMEWYAKEHGSGAFTYPVDWAGFNVPGNVLVELSQADLPDLNKYDIQMRALVEMVQKEERCDNFYFIGTCGEDDYEKDTLNHEIAHGLYYTSEEYRDVMDGLLDEMPRKNYDRAWAALQKVKYHPCVCRDEVHAYAATGPSVELKSTLPLSIRKPFIKAYKEQRKIHK